MKSVCILVQNYYEIDIRVRRKAEALVAAGFSVDVLALASSYSKSRSYVLNGVHVDTLTLGKKRGSLLRYIFEYLAFLVWCFFKVSFRMSTRKYRMIDVNNLPDFLVFAGAYAKLRGAKIVFDMHEITPEFYVSKYGISERALVIRLMKWIEWLSFKFADHVLAINEPIRQLLAGRGLCPERTTVIMNAVDEALFNANASAAAPVEDAGKFIMMYHGTLTRIYGLDLAIEAFAQVHDEMPGAEFWILGNGPEKASLEALRSRFGLEGKVRFVGNVLPEQVPQWLRRCSVGVLATRRDVFLDFSFSNKLSEYIITGKAVIASRLKAIRHYFSEEALAYFEPNEVQDLAKQMIRLFRNAGLRDQLAARARQEYEPISWPVMKARYLKQMTELTGSPTQPAQTADVPVANLLPR